MHIKNNLIKTFLIFFSFLFVFASQPMYCKENQYSDNMTSNNLSLNSRYCVVFDRTSKKVLFGKNENTRAKMASTTKILTATIVIENCSLNKTVEISKKAANTGGSRVGLKTGDKITIRDLLYGLLLCSGNDAAVALAETVAGSVSNFSVLMNNKAKEIGLKNSNFESPHGLDSDNHYTTAYELALLADYALQNPTFLNIVGTQKYTITINGYPKALSNTNELLGNLNGIYGVKTGFTNGANRCLVTSCKRDNMDIICVVLGADTKNFRTQDSIKLIEYTFKTFKQFDVKNFVTTSLENWKKNNPNFFYVEKGLSNNIDIKFDSSFDNISSIPIDKNLISSIEANIVVNSHLTAPIKKDTIIGNLCVSSNGIEIINFNLVSNSNVPKNNISDYIFNFFKFYPKQLENAIF